VAQLFRLIVLGGLAFAIHKLREDYPADMWVVWWLMATIGCGFIYKGWDSLNVNPDLAEKIMAGCLILEIFGGGIWGGINCGFWTGVICAIIAFILFFAGAWLVPWKQRPNPQENW
jgi:quinol-cytochrome oxidoreductase complex cytochrome b subunit